MNRLFKVGDKVFHFQKDIINNPYNKIGIIIRVHSDADFARVDIGKGPIYTVLWEDRASGIQFYEYALVSYDKTLYVQDFFEKIADRIGET